MAKLCAPVRDEKISELTQTKNVVPLFRGILDTLKLMRIDMANFAIDVMRPHIVANSVAYEKQKFNEFLRLQPGKIISISHIKPLKPVGIPEKPGFRNF